MTPGEPQSAVDYDDRTTAAVQTVLIEIGQILGSFKGKFAIVGGAVPWLLLGKTDDMPHVGTMDVDLGLDAEALGDGQYATLVDALRQHGDEKRRSLRRFQLVRQVPAMDDGPPIDVIVDFLMPRDAEIVKNVPPLTSDFAVQRAHGADLALRPAWLNAAAVSHPPWQPRPNDSYTICIRQTCKRRQWSRKRRQSSGWQRHRSRTTAVRAGPARVGG